MVVQRNIDQDAGVSWTTVRGPVTLHDLVQQLDVIHEIGSQQYCGIIDMREAEPHFSARDLPLLAAHGQRLFGEGGMSPRAVIVHQDDLLTFGLSRLLATLSEPWVTMRVFDNVHAAVAYIAAIVESNPAPPTSNDLN